MSGRPGQASGRPKPTAIKRLESRDGGVDRGGRPIRVDEIQPSADAKWGGLPQAPRGMTKRARATWKWILQCMANSGMFTVVDGFQLAYYCELDAHFWELRKEGKMMPSGEIAQLRAFSGMFGLDPASRARPAFPGVRPNLTDPAEDDADALARLRQRKSGTA